MSTPEPEAHRDRSIVVLSFVASAAFAALALHMAWRQPWLGAVGLGIAGVVLLLRWLSRRRAERLFISGDVTSVLNRWSSVLKRVPHASTMAPLMTATALAAYGWVERARAVLQSAERGPAWDAALEHRLFLDALLFTFEGDCGSAIDRADRLARLPMPAAAPALAERITVLRGGVAALARAFAHDAKDGDGKLLIEASDASPLVHWAMRYGAAILAVDCDDLAHATTLIAQAPEWPSESCFSRFHREINDEIGRRQRPAQ